MTVGIQIVEGQGYLHGVPPEAEEPLQKATRFRPMGYQYDWRFQRGKWDGYVKLLRHSKFPAGLTETIIGVLKKRGIPYELQADTAQVDKPRIELEIVGIDDRWYQDEATEAAVLNPRGVIRAPTGSGKTAIGTRIIHTHGLYSLVVVPTIDLLHQYRSFLQHHLRARRVGDPLKIGQLGDGVVDPQPVTVATVRTAAKALDVAYEKYEFGEYDDTDDTQVESRALREWVESLGLVIVDEAHILGAQTVFGITTSIPCPHKYGMSASPWRDDGADLMITAAVGPEIYRIDTAALVRDGYLVPPIIEVVNTAGWWKPQAWGMTCRHCGRHRERMGRGWALKCRCGGTRWRSEFPDAYRIEIVENDERNRRVAQKVLKSPSPRLVLVKQIKHGRTLEKLLPGSRFLSGKDSGAERVAVYEGVRSGEVQTVVATTIADLGLDLPALKSLILAGGGKSSTRHLQRIGRVARTYPGKSAALVVDFDDTHVHKWFREHTVARRKIEQAEWGETAIWL